MVFRLASTFTDPTGTGARQGFPAPGAGGQTTGAYTPPPAQVPWWPLRLAKGVRSKYDPTQGEGAQMQSPTPGAPGQERWGWGPGPQAYGLGMPVETPYYDRGAAAVVQNYGKVLENPIGAGIVALSRPQASYGGAAQYDYGALWWTSQAIPTSINLQGLTDPEALNEILGSVAVQAVVRTTG